jgi:hypothetical protein
VNQSIPDSRLTHQIMDLAAEVHEIDFSLRGEREAHQRFLFSSFFSNERFAFVRSKNIIV